MNIENQVLSRKQMAYLKKLGIDVSDASMYWIYNDNDGYWYVYPYNKDYIKNTIPTYTIGDLIEKLPKEIEMFYLKIDYNDRCIKYSDNYKEEFILKTFEFKTKSFKDALCDCFCWVVENYKNLYYK